jgi:subtilase family serine protease
LVQYWRGVKGNEGEAIMRRVLMLAAALGLLLVATTAASAESAQTLGQKRACTTGQVRCNAIIVTQGGRTLRAITPNALPAGYGPAAYHNAYSLPTTATTGAATVAIVDAFDDATIYNDLKKYSTTFGIPVLPQCSATVTTSCFKKMNLGAPAGSAVAPGWDVEIALDVETVHAICQNCKIVLVEARSASSTNLAVAENTAAKQAPIVSNSFGAYGDDGTTTASFDSAFNHPNHAIVVSAGDDGYGVSNPASLNTVVAVGGTRLTLNASGGYGSERAWGPDATHNWGTGSGCSSASVFGNAPVAAQPFQSSVAGWANTKCGTNRGDNDVSANADPNTGSAVFASSQGAFIQVGGTSLSAPLIAGVYALKGNATAAAFPASFLYAGIGATNFHDVKTGTDNAGNWPIACPAPSTQCIAKVGYDLPTGVGSPKGLGGF